MTNEPVWFTVPPMTRPRRLRGRHRLAGHQRLVERGAAVLDGAVDRDRLAGANPQPVADLDQVEGDLVLGAVRVDAVRGLGGQVEQRLDGSGGAITGAELEDLPQQDERRDDGRGFEVDVDRAVHPEGFGEDPGATVAMTLNNQATPVPIAISVNMFSFRVRTEVQPRSKNGQPPTTPPGWPGRAGSTRRPARR
jgi:hypothetical protein